MIQLLATKFNKRIACFLALVFYTSLVLPLYGHANENRINSRRYFFLHNNNTDMARNEGMALPKRAFATSNGLSKNNSVAVTEMIEIPDSDKIDIDGPSQPEMSSFKPAGTNDMVNLFTGDFSYNIPLLDVGGYPVNIYYDGGITMEQSASWVGLGWNINPGNVNRNMRGVPDDFNGEEILEQQQNMKKNVTWGISVGADVELVGVKAFRAFGGSLGANLGISVNNYLGPSIELGIKGTTSFSALGKNASEKFNLGASVGLSASLSSRNGLTFAPNVSLSSKLFKQAQFLSTSVGLSTSYNSRTGIKSLQISGQMSAGYQQEVSKKKHWAESRSLGAISLYGTTISFAKPSYVPSMRHSITNLSRAGRFQAGAGMFGLYPSFELEGYGQVSMIEPADQTTKKSMIGYLYAEKAKNNRDAVMDFTRFNDQEVTPTTSIVSVPQYSYDVFSIQGEGTGGSIRAYRNDNGYVRDNFTVSKDKSWSLGFDVGWPGHVGGNFNTVKTPNSVGEWADGNGIRDAAGFASSSKTNESVYFRNPGESSVISPGQYDSIGGTDLVRYKLGGTDFSPTIQPKLEKLTAAGAVINTIPVQRATGTAERKKRTQVTNFLSAEEAAIIGLDKKIKSYTADPQNLLDVNNKLSVAEEIDRWSTVGHRRKNQISQINVTEADGKRYVYGIPVYNLVQKDFAFTVADNCSDCDMVPFSSNEVSLSSPHIGSGIGGKDGYTQITITPPYAHSYLLSGLLSPDYVDVNGDGITEDDLGTAVKFNYTKTGVHKWRTPMLETMVANSNPGTLSESKDDKGIISYGERESWYLHSVESKTMIAFFILDSNPRADGKGASAELSGVDENDNSVKSLKKIDLYNKADLKKNGLSAAKPVKSVHFEYNYSLCDNTPDNTGGEGKLTLTKIYFTYNGQNRSNKNQYVFSYTKGSTAVEGENPSYEMNGADRWGNYKPAADNPSSMKNRDYPYAEQDKIKADRNVNAWNLKKILLPSGGQLEIEYESDDYAYVQNKKAAVMSGLLGFSNSAANPTNKLYSVSGGGVITENDYVFIKVPVACNSKPQVYSRYLEGVSQLAFKLRVIMPKGAEQLVSYATINDYGPYTGMPGVNAIWIKLNKVNGYSPLSQTAVEFLRQQLPGQAFQGYDVSDSEGIEQVLNMLGGWLDGIKSAFSDIPKYLRSKGLAQTVETSKSFVRLNDADGYKYGGGYRVKKVTLKDNWNRMTAQYGSVYGQEYTYTTSEVFEGVERTISSGVASYEPSLGGEENPFQTIVQYSNEVPLGPASYGAIEMPVLDAFFPAPLVGYSKVTVTSIGKKQNPDPVTKKTRSGVGKQVTEFYTAKDFPVYYIHTPLDPSSDNQKHVNPTISFFYKYAFDGRAISQGFLVATNDMHGKMKSQSSYAENDLNTRISYTENFYRNTGSKGLEEKFDFVHNNLGGEIREGNMGVDIELMTDTREFNLKSNSLEIQAQVDWMLPPPFPLWLPFVWPVVSKSENIYRAVTTTKVINYHAVLDSVLVIDKGSAVSTKNIVYDAETGQVVVSRTNNEFDKPVYAVTYPAYWAYSGMGLAYKNIDAVYTNINFLDGRIVSGMTAIEIKSVFESGDELYVSDFGSTAGCDPAMASPAEKGLIWAMDKNKNNSSLTNTNPDLIFIDKNGKPYSRTGVSFRIVRSGKRNMLGAPVAAATTMVSPVKNITVTTRKLEVENSSKVVNISAVEYKEKWQTDNDVLNKFKMVNPANGSNLVTNAAFIYANTGFSNDYTYSPNNGTGFTGRYRVSSSSSGWFSGCASCYDHTGGPLQPQYMNFLQIDGNSTQQNRVWYQTVTVQPNTQYRFGCFITSFNETQYASTVGAIRFSVNGTIIDNQPTYANTTQCEWKEAVAYWNSGSNTTATIALINYVTVQNGNDYGIDDISFYADYTCSPIEVADCSGYLEKSINPYRKGLLGNFKGHRNMVFYGERAETNPLSTTNLPENGFLTNVTPYWNFNIDNNLVPDIANTKWVWNTEATRFNSKGMELETKDALGIYTAAQYGYSKTLPVAITANSRSEEMFYDGFEDYQYNDLLNNSVYNNCAKRQIDFSGITNAQVTSSDQAGINAHTGKYVLGVNSNSTAIKTIPVSAAGSNGFDLLFPDRTVPVLNETGGSNIWYNTNGYQTYSAYYLANCIIPYVGVTYGNLSATIGTPFQTNNSNCFSGGWAMVPFSLKTTQYIQVMQTQYYSFTIKERNSYAQGYTSHPSTPNFIDGVLKISKALDNELVASYVSPSTIPQIATYTNEASLTYNVTLCPGVYKIELVANTTDESQIQQTSIGCISSVLSYTCSVNLTSYKSLQTQNVCSYTAPIAGAESMLNSIASIPTGKKMVFSGWVRETNTQVSSYNNNEVQIDFGSGSSSNVTIKPSGPVIEGWQRYEGYFTAPAAVSTMDIKLVNTSGSTIYFDDIRVHPFNANMKSYVYDPVNLRLRSELDANNYASYYEYDEEGGLIRTKAETRQGIKTITETRSAKQKDITDFQ